MAGRKYETEAKFLSSTNKTGLQIDLAIRLQKKSAFTHNNNGAPLPNLISLLTSLIKNRYDATGLLRCTTLPEAAFWIVERPQTGLHRSVVILPTLSRH